MKLTYPTIALLAALTLLSGGCNRENTAPPKEKVEVVMNGGFQVPETTKAQITPVNNLPTNQLDVIIVTVNYTTADPVNDQPDLNAWMGSTADLTRGYFGGPGLGATTITNGEIKYTNEDGTSVQNVFYDENGEYYFVRVVYPHKDAEFIQTNNGAAIVFNDINGSQDILCSNLGWGNINMPIVRSNLTNDLDPTSVGLMFSHKLSLFRFNLIAENEKAAEQYGQIKNVRIRNQPSSIRVDMLDTNTEGYSEFDRHYEAEDFPSTPITLTFSSDPEPVPVAAYAGYIMALPGKKFTIEAETEKRLWISADLDFSDPANPYAASKAGIIYDITLTFMEAYQMELSLENTTEWWVESEFN